MFLPRSNIFQRLRLLFLVQAQAPQRPEQHRYQE